MKDWLEKMMDPAYAKPPEPISFMELLERAKPLNQEIRQEIQRYCVRGIIARYKARSE